MIVAELVLLVVALAAVVVAHRQSVQRIEARVEELLDKRISEGFLERQKSMEKQGRALIREHERTRRMAEEVTNKSRALHGDVQRVLCDSKIQAVLRRND